MQLRELPSAPGLETEIQHRLCYSCTQTDTQFTAFVFLNDLIDMSATVNNYSFL